MKRRKRRMSGLCWTSLAGGLALGALAVRRLGDIRFPSMHKAPSLDPEALEVVASLPRPPGNLAVSATGRIFFTFHPDLRPPVNVVELLDGEPIPYPNKEMQSPRAGQPHFQSVLSLRIDRENRLWCLDHGEHGFKTPRLTAFDLESGALVHRRDFDRFEAPLGSNLNDFQIDGSGRWIYIADASILRRRPAILLYDVETGECRRLLEAHPSVKAEPFTPKVQGRLMLLLGLIPLRTGVDSIALDADGAYLYFAPVTSRHLFRVPTEALRDASLSARERAASVEMFAKKPMTDGIAMDTDGNVYLSAIEESAIMKLSPAGELSSLVRSDMLRWPDGFSFGPEGGLYVTCSALHELLLKGPGAIGRRAPYHILRVKVGAVGVDQLGA